MGNVFEGIVKMNVCSLNLMIVFQTYATVKLSMIDDIPIAPELCRPGCAVVLGHLHNIKGSFQARMRFACGYCLEGIKYWPIIARMAATGQ